jgi:hypothetical protein
MKQRTSRARSLAWAICAATLVTLILFQRAGVTQEPPRDPFGRQPPPQLPFGLDCSQCMIDENSRCAALPRAELVLDARQLQPIDDLQRCYTSQPLDGLDVKTCNVAAGFGFGEVHVLRSADRAVSAKVFLSQYTVEGTPPMHSGGVRLLPDTRYILFTKRAPGNPLFGAQWYVMGACQIPMSQELPETNN